MTAGPLWRQWSVIDVLLDPSLAALPFKNVTFKFLELPWIKRHWGWLLNSLELQPCSMMLSCCVVLWQMPSSGVPGAASSSRRWKEFPHRPPWETELQRITLPLCVMQLAGMPVRQEQWDLCDGARGMWWPCMNMFSLHHRADYFVTSTQVSSQGKLSIKIHYRVLLTMTPVQGKKVVSQTDNIAPS